MIATKEEIDKVLAGYGFKFGETYFADEIQRYKYLFETNRGRRFYFEWFGDDEGGESYMVGSLKCYFDFDDGNEFSHPVARLEITNISFRDLEYLTFYLGQLSKLLNILTDEDDIRTLFSRIQRLNDYYPPKKN